MTRHKRIKNSYARPKCRAPRGGVRRPRCVPSGRDNSMMDVRDKISAAWLAPIARYDRPEAARCPMKKKLQRIERPISISPLFFFSPFFLFAPHCIGRAAACRGKGARTQRRTKRGGREREKNTAQRRRAMRRVLKTKNESFASKMRKMGRVIKMVTHAWCGQNSTALVLAREPTLRGASAIRRCAELLVNVADELCCPYAALPGTIWLRARGERHRHRLGDNAVFLGFCFFSRSSALP